MKYRLQDLIDIEQFQALQDRLNEIYSFPSAIIDNDGNILTATAWQDLCTKFHRKNKECERECIKSDQYILSHLSEAHPAVSYRCPHGLVDNATPIIIDGVHMGNFFTGQFFVEEPDLEFFRVQAKRYGFEEEAYLDAVRKVPVWTQEKLNSYLFFIQGLIEVISGTGLKNLRAIEARQKNEVNEKLFEVMFDLASIGIAQADVHTGQWLRVNQKMCEITGYTNEELLKIRIPEITHPEDRERDWDAFQRVVCGDMPNYRIEKRYIRKDGLVVWVNVNMTVIRNSDDQPICSMATIEDITERKRAEEAIHESEIQYRRLFETMTQGVVYQASNGEIISANPAAERILGLSFEQMNKKTSQDPAWHCISETGSEISGHDHPSMVTLRTGKPVSHFIMGVYNPEKKDHVWLSINTLPLFKPGETTPYQVYAIFEDITVQRQSEENYRMLFSAMLNGFALHEILRDENGNPVDYRFLAVNPAFERMTGLKAQDIVGRTVLEVVPDNVQRWTESFAQVVLTGKPILFENYSDALKRYFEVTAFRPTPNRFACIFVDVTERKRVEETLRESREKLSMALDVGNAGIWEWDVEHGTVHFDERFHTMLGYAPGDLPSSIQEWESYHHPEDVLLLWPKTTAFLRGECAIFESEHRVRCKAGTWSWLFTRGKIVNRAANGDPERFMGIAMNITERKALEEQLQQAHKMESVGRLAGGVAHDFNNMLGVILGHAEMAINAVEPSQPLRVNLEEIRMAAERSADLTRQLLAFARKQTVTPKVLDLNDTVTGMLKMLQRLIGEDIDLAWRPKPDLWLINMDPSQIDQILANLCVNARDAISGVGKVTIETGNHSFDTGYCADHPGFVPGDYVLLAVSDNGHGMDKETLEKLFEPFFTTKEMGKGTGLGLAMVYGIAKQNNGFINVYSEPNHGTSFKIYLPRHMGNAQQTKVENVMDPLLFGHETILVVEDEAGILDLTTTILEKKGYTVLAASTPGEAVRLALEYMGEIHLLITDVVMPEMNGRELVNSLRSHHPYLKSLFMSGYTADVIAHHGVLDEGVHFIQKPFSSQDLAGKVREVLDQA